MISKALNTNELFRIKDSTGKSIPVFSPNISALDADKTVETSIKTASDEKAQLNNISWHFYIHINDRNKMKFIVWGAPIGIEPGRKEWWKPMPELAPEDIK